MKGIICFSVWADFVLWGGSVGINLFLLVGGGGLIHEHSIDCEKKGFHIGDKIQLGFSFK